MMLAGKVALVTGSARGIGRSIALALASAGADVVINDVPFNSESGQAVVQEILALGRRSLFVSCDVTCFDQVEAMSKEIIEHLGQIDILVNNAGITKDMIVLRMKPEDWAAVLTVNLTGTFNCTKAVLKQMLRQKSGKIISIASVIGQRGNEGQANYGASKAGIIGFSKSVAREMGPKGITVNCIAPGFIESKMTESLPPEARANLEREIPLNRLGQPEDVAGVVVFLASPAADYITGQTINVDGGMVMHS